MRRATRMRRMVVLQSIEPFRREQALNPYIPLMLDAVSAEVDVLMFTWRAALLGRYDVFHLQWPENLARRSGRGRRMARPLLIALLLARLRVRRTPVVQTMHNVSPHESGSRLDRMLVRAWNRRTASWIVLNERTPTPRGVARTVVPHGHYRSWHPIDPAVRRRRGELLFFGLVRPYKGIETLIEVFGRTTHDDVHLRIVGAPWAGTDTTGITDAAAADPRVSLELRFLSTRELTDAIRRASAVVLPYRDMHNSGALLLALSLGRPVIVPRTAVNDDLAREFGADWVRLYDGELTPAVLAALPDVPDDAAPDLSSRDWPQLGRAIVAVYRQSLER